MNVDKPRNTTNGCTHQLSARCVCPKPARDNGTSIRDIEPLRVLTLHPYQALARARLKIRAVAMIQRKSLSLFSETMPQVNDKATSARTRSTSGTSALWYSFRDRQFKDWPSR